MSNLKTLRARKDVRLTGAGNPTVATVASVTDTYQNETTGELFTCTESVDYGWGFVQDWAGSQGTLIDADVLNPANANLVAMYTMDNISGSKLVNEQGNTSRDGTMVGTLPTVTGKIDNALDPSANPSGSAAPACYVNIDNQMSIVGDLAWSWWWNIDSTLKTRACIGGATRNPDAALYSFLALIDGDWYWLAENTTATILSGTMPADGWHHMVAQRVGSTIEFFVDGALVGSLAEVGPGTFDVDTLLTYYTPDNSGAAGIASMHTRYDTDQIRIFDRALTQDEIVSLYHEGEPPANIVNTDHPALEAMWTMDNVSGSTLVDESANNNDATITDAIQVSGKIGQALSFDGAGFDHVVLSNGGSLFPETGFSFTGWVKTIDSQFTIVGSVSQGATFITQGFQLNAVGGDLYAQFRNGGAHVLIVNPDFVSDGSWQFVSVTFDGTTGSVRVNNGTEVTADASSYQQNLSNDLVIAAQRVPQDPDDPFAGDTDQYRVFNRPLTDEEIFTLYNEGLA